MEILEKISELNDNNIYYLIGFCIMFISTATGYIQLFHASAIEAILMNRREELKRFSFIYFILFVVFAVINYMFINNFSSIVCNFGLLILALLINGVLWILKIKGKAIELYWKFKERKDIIVIMTLTTIIIFFVAKLFHIELISCAIWGALGEVIILAITILNVKNVRSTFILNIENEKWYVFKRLNDDYLLCGDKSNINDATKIRLLEFNSIVEQNLCFNKDLNVSD